MRIGISPSYGAYNRHVDRDESTIVIKKVPANICDSCSEYYLSDEVSGKILAMAEEALKLNHEVEVIQFTA